MFNVFGLRKIAQLRNVKNYQKMNRKELESKIDLTTVTKEEEEISIEYQERLREKDNKRRRKNPMDEDAMEILTKENEILKKKNINLQDKNRILNNNFRKEVRAEKVSSSEGKNINKIIESIANRTEPLIVFQETKIKKIEIATVLPMMDVHLGKLSWKGETGEDVDHIIISKDFRYSIREAITLMKARGTQKVIYPIGNDFFNVDKPNNTTTAGTFQDNDLRWQKMFELGFELQEFALIELAKHFAIEALFVCGNHDFQTSFYLVHMLKTRFRNYKNVTINSCAKPRKYIKFGNTLLGFTHGDKERNNILVLMQTESRKMWGETIFSEWIEGHLHSEQTIEKGGIIIRNLPSIVGTDSWHNQSGYKGAIRKTKLLHYDIKDGNIGCDHILISK